MEQSKREIIEWKLRVFYQKPLVEVDRSSYVSNIDLIEQDGRFLIRKQMNFLATQIANTEKRYYHSQSLFEAGWKKMLDNHRNLIPNKGMPTTLLQLIEKRIENMKDKLRDVYKYRIDYYLRNSSGQIDQPAGNRTTTTTTHDKNASDDKIGLLPSMIIDTKHSFDDRQLQLLQRGPTYVPPCQMYIASSFQINSQVLKKQFASLQHQLATLYSEYRVKITESMEMDKLLHEEFQRNFSGFISSSLQQRAVFEKNLIQSIQLSLKENHLILRRTADQMNTFYLGDLQAFEAKANDYLTDNDAFEVRVIIDQFNHDEQPAQKELKERIELINYALNILKRRKALDENVIKRLLLDVNRVKMPYLYFLPSMSQVR
jgi:hypothetical protein